jgi:hypothetical protein
MTRIRFGGFIPRVGNSQPCVRRAPLSASSVLLITIRVKGQPSIEAGDSLALGWR